MLPLPRGSLAAVALYAAFAAAARLPIERRDAPHSASMRLSLGGNASDPFNFQSIKGLIYTTTIHINGQPFQVQMDTGSSDLWINTAGKNLSGAVDTGILGAVKYEDTTSAIGNLTLIDITWGNFTVKNQIFIDAPTANATHNGLIDGLLGLGPQVLSNISAAIERANSSVNSNTLLDNIFDLYPEEPNFISFLLTRNVAGVVDGGDFTIGEIVQEYEEISSAPKLPVASDSSRWLTFIDGIVVNGKQVSAPSNGFPGIQVPEGKVTAIFDTGISLDVAPRFFVDAMFKDVPDALFDDESNLYIVPCDTKINMSLAIGELEYPIHPLDLVSPIELDGSDISDVVCVGNFLASTKDTSIGDFQFGDVVLRNLYTLFDFGNWSRVGDSPPFIQLLNLTDQSQAWAEFDAMQAARIQQFFEENSDPNSSSALSESATGSSATSTTSDSIAASTVVTTSASVATVQNSEVSSVTAAPSDSSTITSAIPTTARIASTSTTSPQEFAAGALSDDSIDTSLDLNSLIRNSYIIIGLLALAIVLLIGIAVMTLMRRMSPRARGRYKTIVPEQETYSGPTGRYSD